MSAAAEWRAQLPPLLAAARERRVGLLCQPDWSSPIHGGLLLFFPSAALYADGVRVLRAAAFDQP